MANWRKSKTPGVYVAHQVSCPAQKADDARCRCAPSWRGRRWNANGGMVDESTLLGKGKELGRGESEVVSFDLKAGSHELICYLPGHYVAGQKTAFTVE